MTPGELLTTIAACLCEQIRTDGLPEPCFCGVIPGEGPVVQYAGDCGEKCGMAWVRMANLYPSDAVGRQNETPGNCGSGLGMDLEVGIMRCIDIPDEHGPSPEELSAATDLQTRDAMCMWRALNCCTALNNKDFVLGMYVPAGPEGGMVGGTFSVFVSVP